MKDGRKIIAIVPARSGSKGIPDKNMRTLGGRTLIARAAQVLSDPACAWIDLKLLSTDSERYAQIARYYGAEVPFLRPVEIAGVKSPDIEWVAYTLERLAEAPGVHVIGPPAEERCGVVAFTVESIHPHDLAYVLDGEGVAIRGGRHCAQPLHERFGLGATARASFYLYNTREEVDRLVEGIQKAQGWF